MESGSFLYRNNQFTSESKQLVSQIGQNIHT